MCLTHKDLTVNTPAVKSTTTYSISIFMPKVPVTASANQGGRAHSKDQIVDDRTDIKWILTKRVTRRGLESCSSGQWPLPERCKYGNKNVGLENEGKFVTSRSAVTKEFLLIGYLIEHGKRNTGHSAKTDVCMKPSSWDYKCGTYRTGITANMTTKVRINKAFAH